MGKSSRKWYGKVMIAFLLAVCVNITGCSNETTNENKKPIDVGQKEWNSEELDDNLIADFEVSDEYADKAELYYCTKEFIPVETIKEAFFNTDTSKTKITEWEYDPDVPELGNTQELISENGLDIYSNCFGSVGKTTDADYYTNFLASDPDSYWGKETEPRNFGTKEEFSYLSKQTVTDAITNGMAIISSDIFVSQIDFYSLPSSYLNELQNKELDRLKKEDPSWYDSEIKYKRDWKEDEGAYYVIVKFQIGQLPLYDEVTTRFSDGKRAEQYKAYFIFNKSGCVSAELPSIMCVDDKQEKILLSAAECLEALREDLASVILLDENTITSGEMKYVITSNNTSLDCEIIPMWIYENNYEVENEKGGDSIKVSEYYFVNAVTGEVYH